MTSHKENQRCVNASWECTKCEIVFDNYASFQYHMLTTHSNREGR